MTRRPGMSLTEVLVALFILTIGVVGILTMFPLGAAQMARAVRDDRSALAANQADGFMRWYWATYVANPMITSGNTATQPNFQFTDQYLLNGSGLFDNPSLTGGTGVAALPSLSLSNTNANQVSYPVLLDPMGYAARGTNFGDSTPYAAIPRCTLNSNAPQFQSPSPLFYYRTCSLLDSLGYNDNGTPTPDREMRYNFMWLLQRTQTMTQMTTTGPKNLYNSNNTSMVNMTVIVFDRRAFMYPPAGVPGFEVVMPATFAWGTTAVQIPPAYLTQALDLKPGSWVMDASSLPTPAPSFPYPIHQANFYRVVSVVQAGGAAQIELETPVAPPTGYPTNYGPGQSFSGTLVALSGVSGVFVRPPLTPYP